MKFQVNMSSAPDVFNMVQADAALARGGNWLETQFKTITARETLLRVVEELKLEESWGVSAADAVSRLEGMILTMKPVSRSTSSRWLAAGLLAAGLGVLWLVNRKKPAVPEQVRAI